MGLMDQQLALQWIYENINSFGGDPDKVCSHAEFTAYVNITTTWDRFSEYSCASFLGNIHSDFIVIVTVTSVSM